MSGNGLFFEKSNDELIWLPGGREILEGGRASWLVPFGVINHYTKQSPPPKESEDKGKEEKGCQKAREEERWRERKNNKKLLTNERKKI